MLVALHRLTMKECSHRLVAHACDVASMRWERSAERAIAAQTNTLPWWPRSAQCAGSGDATCATGLVSRVAGSRRIGQCRGIRDLLVQRTPTVIVCVLYRKLANSPAHAWCSWVSASHALAVAGGPPRTAKPQSDCAVCTRDACPAMQPCKLHEPPRASMRIVRSERTLVHTREIRSSIRVLFSSPLCGLQYCNFGAFRGGRPPACRWIPTAPTRG